MQQAPREQILAFVMGSGEGMEGTGDHCFLQSLPSDLVKMIARMSLGSPTRRFVDAQFKHPEVGQEEPENRAWMRGLYRL
eukprot:1352334-Rhodomonas_salina.1